MGKTSKPQPFPCGSFTEQRRERRWVGRGRAGERRILGKEREEQDNFKYKKRKKGELA